MAFVTQTLNLSPSLGERFEILRSKWTQAAQRRKTYNRVYDELSQLSNRELADLNLSRANIESIAREASRG